MIVEALKIVRLGGVPEEFLFEEELLNTIKDWLSSSFTPRQIARLKYPSEPFTDIYGANTDWTQGASE